MARYDESFAMEWSKNVSAMRRVNEVEKGEFDVGRLGSNELGPWATAPKYDWPKLEMEDGE